MFRRILLFLVTNLLVVLVITTVLSLFNIRPYLTAYGLDLKSLAIFCLVWGMVGAFISLSLSRVMAKWIFKISPVRANATNAEERLLFSMVQRLTEKAQLPMPEVGVYASKEVNAFATGPSKTRSLIAVSSGLLEKMKESDLEAVLAHEVSHIANGDMVTMTLLQGVVNSFVMFLARVFAMILSGLGKSRNERGSMMSYILFVYLFEIVFMILGSLVIAAYSRFREFRADRGGARLSSKESMVSALQTLRVMQEIRDAKAENPAMAAFKISYPNKKRGFFSLFASHPPLEERIERLQSSPL